METAPKYSSTCISIVKIIATVLFIVLPFLGFFVGMNYQASINESLEVPTTLVRKPTPTSKQGIDKTASQVPTGTLANWKTYVNEKLGIEFKYPDQLIQPAEENGKIILKHSISLEHPDPCDAKGTGLIKKDIEDLKVVFEVIKKNLIETFGSNYSFLQEKYIKDNKIKLEPGFIDESNYGLLKGYRVTESVEGCGNYTFYFPISAQKTLLIKRQFVPELNPIIVNYKENLKIPGIIPPKTEEQIFDQILSTFKFADQYNDGIDNTSNSEYICETAIGGKWLAEYNECVGTYTGLTSRQCSQLLNGIYDECVSPCRHDPKYPDVNCITVCIPVCKLQ